MRVYVVRVLCGCVVVCVVCVLVFVRRNSQVTVLKLHVQYISVANSKSMRV